MKRLTQLLTVCAVALTLNLQTHAAQPSKTEKRIAYTIKNLKLNATQQKALQPILTAYCAEMKAAKKKYEELKKKYERDIDMGTLTDNASKALLDAKFEAETKELEVKKAYRKKLEGVIPLKKVFSCYDLINDKMSKVEGKKKKTDDDDD